MYGRYIERIKGNLVKQKKWIANIPTKMIVVGQNPPAIEALEKTSQIT